MDSLIQKDLKVAIIADWLTNQGGAERVVQTLHEMFPSAPIYTSIYTPEKLPQFKNADVRTSFIQKLPFAKRKHQLFLNLMPMAFEEFDLSEYDVVISSASSCAKGVITKPETVHICYCHTPMRYAWDDSHSYIQNSSFPRFLKKWYIPKSIKNIRMWDRLAADRVEYFVANSHFIQQRIKKYYERDSFMIHPPVDTSQFSISNNVQDYYLASGRLIAYKRFDLVVEAFNQLKLPLIISGDGPEYKHLKHIAQSNITFTGYISDKERNKLMKETQALIFPQIEDFGIIPVEVMASGRPVIAYYEGGAGESVIDGTTGILFKHQTPEDIISSVKKLQKKGFSPLTLRKHALSFDAEQFKKKMGAFVSEKYSDWKNVLANL